MAWSTPQKAGTALMFAVLVIGGAAIVDARFGLNLGLVAFLATAPQIGSHLAGQFATQVGISGLAAEGAALAGEHLGSLLELHPLAPALASFIAVLASGKAVRRARA